MFSKTEYIRDYMRKYRKRVKDYSTKRRAFTLKALKAVGEYKESRPCKDCDRKYLSCIMQFDHVRGE